MRSLVHDQHEKKSRYRDRGTPHAAKEKKKGTCKRGGKASVYGISKKRSKKRRKAETRTKELFL